MNGQYVISRRVSQNPNFQVKTNQKYGKLEERESVSYVQILDENSCVLIRTNTSGCARGVVVIVVGNGHGNTSSNPGWDWLHFT